MSYKDYKLCPFNTTSRTIPFGREITSLGITSTIGNMADGYKTTTEFEICMKEQCMAWDDKKNLCKRLK